MNNFTFYTSISSRSYDHKPTHEEFKSITYNYNIPTDLDGFVDCITSGHLVTGVYQQQWRNDRNFLYTHFVAFDYDHSPSPLSAYINGLDGNLLPTFAYSTYTRTNEDGTYRFRLVYLFDIPLDRRMYSQVYDSLSDALNFTDDACTKSVCQQICGTTKDCELYRSSIIYSPDQWGVPNVDNEKEKKQTNTSISMSSNETYRNFIPQGSDLYRDLNTMSPTDFLDEYLTERITHSYPIEEYNSHEVFDQAAYIELPSPYRWVNTDGRNERVCVRFKHNRHNSLRHDANIIHNIKPDISVSLLLANLVKRRFDYDNEDHELDNKFLINVVNCEMSKADITIKNYQGPRRRYKVNRAWCIANRQSVRAFANHINKELRKDYALSCYDCALSVAENAKVLGVSAKTLKKYLQEEGLTTQTEAAATSTLSKERIKELKRQGALTLEILDANKAILPRSTYFRYRRELSR